VSPPTQNPEKQLGSTLEDGEPQVREVWVGNLAYSVTETKLYSYFFIFGEIEGIEMFMFKNFAFIRFKEVNAAIRACEQGKKMIIDGRQIKVTFSDHTKRKDVAGDAPNYKLTEKTAKSLLIQYKTGNVCSEEVLKNVLGRYGRIKAVFVKPVQPGSYQKPSIYVDYMSHVFIFFYI
jgi:RNA recognition motif-containing protein